MEFISFLGAPINNAHNDSNIPLYHKRDRLVWGLLSFAHSYTLPLLTLSVDEDLHNSSNSNTIYIQIQIWPIYTTATWSIPRISGLAPSNTVRKFELLTRKVLLLSCGSLGEVASERFNALIRESSTWIRSSSVVNFHSSPTNLMEISINSEMSYLMELSSRFQRKKRSRKPKWRA